MNENNFNKRACLPSHLLSIELQQSANEGKDISPFVEDAKIIAALPDAIHMEREQRATELFFNIQASAVMGNYPYQEPTSWEDINAACETNAKIPPPIHTISFDNVWGGVLGKCIGCLVGKPIEGWKKNTIRSFLKETNNFPIHRYLFDNVSNEVAEKYTLPLKWTRPLAGMPEDDDVSYLLLAFKIINEFGIDFKPYQVAETWTQHIPLRYLCTAERIAYRNFTNGIYPPESSYFCNPYREWIGAQIRADVYGYLSPGNPLLAMELAWKDASISHVKNGIYGSIWVAVMLALVPNYASWEEVIEQSLNYIPAQSRFSQSILSILHSFKENRSLETVISQLHSTYDESNIHHWCHVVPNAMLVATALLWSKQNMVTALHIVMSSGFDTDSNGATVGSLMGYRIGASKIPDYWKNILQNHIFSPVVGMNETNIKQFATDLFGFLSQQQSGTRQTV
jgi:ADP-ribosylglycohydrolase